VSDRANESALSGPLPLYFICRMYGAKAAYVKFFCRIGCFRFMSFGRSDLVVLCAE
jgi:hypothetical protein